MSAAMLALSRGLPTIDPRSLPPRQVTYEAAESVHARFLVDDETGDVLTTAAHFGYGATMGALFGALFGRQPARPVAQGIGFGLAVWAGSYCGWLPAIDSRAAAQHQGLRRNALMIAAHVVWGASLGAFYQSASSPPATSAAPAQTSDRRTEAKHANLRQ